MTPETYIRKSRRVDRLSAKINGSELKVLRAVLSACEAQSSDVATLPLHQMREATNLCKGTLTTAIKGLVSKGLLCRDWRAYYPAEYSIPEPQPRVRQRAA